MENTYTITLYCFDHGFSRGPSGIFTKTRLLKEAGRIKGTEPFTDVDAAKEVVAKNFNVPSWSIRQLELPLTLDDYSGNIRPEGQFAEELDLGILQNSVGYDSAIVKSFPSFSSEDKIIICDFIEKAIKLYAYNTDTYDEVYAFLRLRLQSIVSEFVRDLFREASSQTPKRPPMLMEKFNGLELDELKRMLLDVVNGVSIKELVENRDDLNAKLARAFALKVVASRKE